VQQGEKSPGSTLRGYNPDGVPVRQTKRNKEM